MKTPEMEDLVFRITTAALTSSTTLKYAPLTGLLNSVTVHFPAGCQQLVEVFLWYKRQQVFPHPPDGLVGDDTTQKYAIYQNVRNRDPLEVRILNHDALNQHTVIVILHIDGQGVEVL